MDDIFKMFDGLVSKSAQDYVSSRGLMEQGRWKYCVALAKLGWKAYDFEAIPNKTENEVIIKWRKEGQEEIHLKLCFTDQCLWIKYMQRQEEKKNDKRK